MKLKPEDIHSLTIVSLDPTFPYAEELVSSIENQSLKNIGEVFTGKKELSSLNQDELSAYHEIYQWANPIKRKLV